MSSFPSQTSESLYSILFQYAPNQPDTEQVEQNIIDKIQSVPIEQQYQIALEACNYLPVDAPLRERLIDIATHSVHALNSREKYNAAFLIYHIASDHNPAKQDALRMAFETIGSLYSGNRFEAAQEIYRRSESNTHLQREALERAFETIEHLPDQQQFYAAHQVYLQLHRKDSLKSKALEKMCHDIDKLPPENIFSAAMAVYHYLPDDSPYKVQVYDKAVAASEEHFENHTEDGTLARAYVEALSLHFSSPPNEPERQSRAQQRFEILKAQHYGPLHYVNDAAA